MIPQIYGFSSTVHPTWLYLHSTWHISAPHLAYICTPLGYICTPLCVSAPHLGWAADERELIRLAVITQQQSVSCWLAAQWRLLKAALIDSLLPASLPSIASRCARAFHVRARYCQSSEVSGPQAYAGLRRLRVCSCWLPVLTRQECLPGSSLLFIAGVRSSFFL